MKLIREGLLELNRILFTTNISYAVLDGLNFLIIGLLFLASLNLWWGYALIPAAIYFVVHTNYLVSHRTYLLVENKVPQLKEALRTAVDTQNQDTYIAKLLHDDVVRNLARVKSSFFINYQMLGAKLVTLCTLSILVIMVSAFHVQFGGISSLIGDIITTPFEEAKVTEKGTEIKLLSEEGFLDIYGDKRLATLSSKELDLKINPIAGEIDTSIITDVIDHDFVTPQFPKEIYTSADVSYQERVPQKNQQVVRDYFRTITR